jgi:hypothetical protein
MKLNKLIATRFALKMVSAMKFDTIKVSGSDSKPLTEEEYKNGEQGFIYAPYICVSHTDESLKKYNKFMKKYRSAHEACPRCGDTSYSTTLIGYPLVAGHEDEFKDLNICICTNCKDRHTGHERISKKEFKLKK